jgi:hypothetical protein
MTTKLDANQVLKHIFDEQNNRIKVESVSAGDASLNVENVFNEITEIQSGQVTSILEFTSTKNSKLVSVGVAGTNVATYMVYIDGALAAKKYTFFQKFNEVFDFKNLTINPGNKVEIKVEHQRPYPGSFCANILIAS